MTNKTKIAFTSCMHQGLYPDQPHWQYIEQANPDYLFLLGDQIYMDFSYCFLSDEPNGSPRRYSTHYFRQRMEEKYQAQWAEPHFASLMSKMREKHGVFGVWDDHDFAWNNAYGSEVDAETIAISRELFHRYMDCSTNRPEIYCQIDIPDARVIFLDVRSHAQPPRKRREELLGKRRPPHHPRMLGETQFEFLRQALEHEHSYTLICSGLSLTKGFENWAMYPEEYEQFRQLIAAHPQHRFLFLAGDIHKNFFGPINQQRPCYEIASSGMAINMISKFTCLWDGLNHHNWCLLEYDADEVLIRFYSKDPNRPAKQYRIDAHDWSYAKFA